MLFGRAKDAEKVSAERLPHFLNAAFDAKLSDFVGRAQSLIRDMGSSKAMFYDSCTTFGTLDKEPDLEYVFTSATGVKKMKSAYVKALQGLDYKEGVEKGDNSYERYSKELLKVENFIRKVGEANNAFKLVLSAYSNGLGGFRKSFSGIEKVTKGLKEEIERRGTEKEEYDQILSNVRKLLAVGVSLKAEESQLAEWGREPSRQDQDAEGRQRRKEETRTSLSARNVQIRDVDMKMSELGGNISKIMGPLARPARKYDHAHAEGSRLSDYISQPIEHLADDGAAYREFYSMVDALSKELNSGGIEVASNKEAMHSAGKVLDGSLLACLDNFRKLRDERSSLTREASGLERELSGINIEETAVAERAARLEGLKSNVKEMSMAISRTKKEIEEQFLKYYRLEIEIILS